MAMRRAVVVQSAAQMWPRLVFDSDSSPAVKGCLRHPGVYVLFRDDEPYHVGKTKNKLFRQIRAHAVRTRDRYYHFWNYFSAFIVPNARHRGEKVTKENKDKILSEVSTSKDLTDEERQLLAGYAIVNAVVNGKHTTIRLHRLVMNALRLNLKGQIGAAK